LRLWKWEYTDEFGKQRKTRYLLTEADALARLRDPVRVEGTLEIRDAERIDKLLSGLAQEALAGRNFTMLTVSVGSFSRDVIQIVQGRLMVATGQRRTT